MKHLLPFLFSVLLIGCTINLRQVGPSTDPQSLVGMGFVGYTLEESQGYKTYIHVKNIQTDKNFKFLLNNSNRDKNKKYFGPWKLYDSDSNNTTTMNITITALNPGQYKIYAFSLETENHGGSGGASENIYPANGDLIEITENKVSYIGSFSVDSKHILPWDINLKNSNLSSQYLSIYPKSSYNIQIVKVKRK